MFYSGMDPEPEKKEKTVNTGSIISVGSVG